MNEGNQIESKRDERAFRNYMKLFFDVWSDIFKGEILDCLQGREKSINASITKKTGLLSAERTQGIRSSSDAHHKNN